MLRYNGGGAYLTPYEAHGPVEGNNYWASNQTNKYMAEKYNTWSIK